MASMFIQIQLLSKCKCMLGLLKDEYRITRENMTLWPPQFFGFFLWQKQTILIVVNWLWTHQGIITIYVTIESLSRCNKSSAVKVNKHTHTDKTATMSLVLIVFKNREKSCKICSRGFVHSEVSDRWASLNLSVCLWSERKRKQQSGPCHWHSCTT